MSSSITERLRTVVVSLCVVYLLGSTAALARSEQFGFWWLDVDGQVRYSETVDVVGSWGWAEWQWGTSLLSGIYTSGSSSVSPSDDLNPQTCGDERDAIIGEYSNRAFKPMCSSFTTSLPASSSFTFSQWKSTAHTNHSHAVLRPVIVMNAESVMAWADLSTWWLVSGYRCPLAQSAVSSALNGRHIYGDAVDIDTPGLDESAELWDHIKGFADQAGACVEPRSMASNHIHMDYRHLDGATCHWM